MSCYNSLAKWYDPFTKDIQYDCFTDFYISEFGKNAGEFKLILDLCCGTGTITCYLARLGYDMIGVDSSPEMLNIALEKASAENVTPLFICQDAAELDLYGTVDACISSLDSINYIPPKSLPEVFRRLNLFIRPGGVFIFDIRSAESLTDFDGSTFVDESEDALCLWRADYDSKEKSICFGMDIFSREGSLWKRDSEEHVEYLYSLDEITEMLSLNGFEKIKTSLLSGTGNDRIFFSCIRA